MQSKDFHITISLSSEEFNFENDLRLVKSSLLYADKIKLCSPIASEAIRYLTVTENSTPKKQSEFLEAFASNFMNDAVSQRFLSDITEYKKLLRIKHLNNEQLRRKLVFERAFKESFLPIKQRFLEVSENLGMTPLLPLIKSDILEIHSLGEPANFDYDKLIKKFVKFLEETISNCNTYPLFNDVIGNIVRLGIQAEKMKVSEHGIARGKQSALAVNLLERLPLFDEAEIDEILDIKVELERPLKRFRSAMIRFSEGIKNASWDENFSHDAEVVFMRDIEPSILDIEDAIKSNNYLASLTRKIVDRPLTLATGSALGILISPLSELPKLITTSLGIFGSASIVAYDAYKEWKQNNLKTEQNNLFFYYKAKKNLSKLK
ncbi:MAG: hypothetical protein ACR2LT_04395 [Pyrinomonadaceae bacterium]